LGDFPNRPAGENFFFYRYIFYRLWHNRALKKWLPEGAVTQLIF